MMKIENTNLLPLNGTAQSGSRVSQIETAESPENDDTHLSELVRTLRSLVPDSPERQERLEQIARAYANGTYEMDAEATAGGIIDDGLRYR